MGGEELLTPVQFTEELLEAARNQDWEKIDNQLVPQLRQIDGDMTAGELLKYVGDENSNIRDVVATSFAGLKNLDDRTEGEVAEAMFHMATDDDERYPAGRAMAYLLTLRDRTRFNNRVSETLVTFKQRAQIKGWVDDLKKSISSLAEIF